ncbi:hypothetical protein CGCTS75_v000024 [Colletotrichum tropicale]|nr:hypothetical protein CGCTS75_v000024 [Colletotrichum tropicale]
MSHLVPVNPHSTSSTAECNFQATRFEKPAQVPHTGEDSFSSKQETFCDKRCNDLFQTASGSSRGAAASHDALSLVSRLATVCVSTKPLCFRRLT